MSDVNSTGTSDEAFMPAHEAGAEPPLTEEAAGGEVDTLPGDEGRRDEDAEAGFDPSAVTTSFRPPVPGERMSAERLEDDLGEH